MFKKSIELKISYVRFSYIKSCHVNTEWHCKCLLVHDFLSLQDWPPSNSQASSSIHRKASRHSTGLSGPSGGIILAGKPYTALFTLRGSLAYSLIYFPAQVLYNGAVFEKWLLASALLFKMWLYVHSVSFSSCLPKSSIPFCLTHITYRWNA